jgi:hypothetical protein
MESGFAARAVLALVIVLAGASARAQSTDREARTQQLYSELEVLTNELGETSAHLGHVAPLALGREPRAPLAHPERPLSPRPPILAGNALDCTLGALTSKAQQRSGAAPTTAVPMNCALDRLGVPGGVRELDSSRR